MAGWLPRSSVESLGSLRVGVLQRHENSIKLRDSLFQLRDGVGRKLLGVGEFVGVFEGFVLEPLEAVDLEVAVLDLGDVEAAPAALLRIAGTSVRSSERIGAKAGFELGEVLRGKGALLLGDAGDVGATIIDRDVLGGRALW